MASAARRCHVWVGAETGVLKGVDLRNKRATNHGGGWAPEGGGGGVCALCWAGPEESEILVGCRDRSVRSFSTEKGKFTGWRLCPGGDGAFCGLAACGSDIITCVESGLIKVWREDGTESVSLEAGPGLSRMRQDPRRPQRVGTGGRENGLKVWDLQRPREPLFRAKNVRNDWLDLRVPVWDRDLQFLPGSEKIVTCTAHGQVRLYDPGSPRRRPVLEATFGEAPLTALSPLPGETSVAVGSARGDLVVIDLRQGRVQRRLRGGPAGSVRGLQAPPGPPLLVSCGLDRFLRVHHLRDGRPLHRVYLKSRLSCLLLRSRDWEEVEEPPPPEGEGKEKEEEEEGGGDALWDALEPIPPLRPPAKKTSGL